MSLPNDNYGRLITLVTTSGQDTYTVTDPVSGAIFTVSYDTGTPQSNAYQTINAMPANAPLVIADVSPRQIRLAMIQCGLYPSQIDALVATMPQPQQAQTQAWWDYSISFQRNQPLVMQIAAAVGWSSAQVDALWLLAATL
jgi:hypothetical protein